MAATEAKVLRHQSVTLSLLVLLTNALIGRQPRQSLAQVVVIRLPYYKQPSRKLCSNSFLVHGSTVLIMGEADQRVPAEVMVRTICIVFCPVGCESAADRIFSVEDHHHHQDH